MKSSTLLVGLALGLMGCSTDAPTGATAGPISIPWELSAQQATAIGTLLADARQLLVPALADRTLAGNLARLLATATASLADRERARFGDAMVSARTLIDARIRATMSAASASVELDSESPNDAPVVETLQLMIDLIDAAASAEVTPS